MKKILLASAAVLTLGVGAYSVTADASEIDSVKDNNQSEYVEEFGPRNRRDSLEFNEDRQERFEERSEERAAHREERIQIALDEGRVTEEEATEWRKDIEEREQNREEFGYSHGGHHGGRRNRSDQRGYEGNGFGHCR